MTIREYLNARSTSLDALFKLLGEHAFEFWDVRDQAAENSFDTGFNEYAYQRLRSEGEDDSEDYFYRFLEASEEQQEIQSVYGEVAGVYYEIAASANVFAGAILQLAHQALYSEWGSTAKDDRDSLPVGREVYGIPVREIIWHGRNQAAHSLKTSGQANEKMHEYKKLISDGIAEEWHTHLAGDFMANFDPDGRSVAGELLKILNWRNSGELIEDLALYEKPTA